MYKINLYSVKMLCVLENVKRPFDLCTKNVKCSLFKCLHCSTNEKKNVLKLVNFALIIRK